MKENEKRYSEYTEDFYNINKDDATGDAGMQMYLKGYLEALRNLGIAFIIHEDGTLKIFGGVGSIAE